MPSQFEKSFAASCDSLYATFGIAGTYTPPAGTAVAVTVRIQRGSASVEIRDGVELEVQAGKAMVRQSELAGIARDGRLTIEQGEVWTILAPPTLVNGQWHCDVERAAPSRREPRRAGRA